MAAHIVDMRLHRGARLLGRCAQIASHTTRCCSNSSSDACSSCVVMPATLIEMCSRSIPITLVCRCRNIVLCDASAIASCSFASVAASTAAAPFACAVSARAAAHGSGAGRSHRRAARQGGRAFEHAAELEDVVAQRRMIRDQLTPRRRDPGTQLVRHVDARAAPALQQPARDEPLGRLAHRIARHAVFLRKHALRRQARAGRPGPSSSAVSILRITTSVRPRAVIAAIVASPCAMPSAPIGPTNLSCGAVAGIMQRNRRPASACRAVASGARHERKAVPAAAPRTSTCSRPARPVRPRSRGSTRSACWNAKA